MKKILITGGAVHGKLDDVKLVTNRFRGGMMAEIADLLAGRGFEIVYLTAKRSSLPLLLSKTEIVFHDGFYDYREKVLAIAPTVDGILLGGAVANLIPQKPFPGKFPSHNYKPGDVINIPFVIAPRVIDEVKKVAPKVNLFGFKLLSGVPLDELVGAAYSVLRESKADFVFANDATNLAMKYAVTKEKSAIQMDIEGLACFVASAMEDVYYETKMVPVDNNIEDANIALYLGLINRYKRDFVEHNNFGTVAVRLDNNRFITTTRTKTFGNDDLIKFVVVSVDHSSRVVTCAGDKKATMNAPLLSYLLNINPQAKSIAHIHKQIEGLPTLPYASPATVRDSIREMHESFNIEHHGCYLIG